jgi:crotonobetainyl-CoA:carnitine CoA-transferase CaiB-like acyl-CoA transferase
VRKLAAEADVIIENYKVGDLAKYGLDYSSLKQINPALVYCSVTGFGQDGPYASRAGYDLIIQGMGGIMDLTGEPDREPMRVGVAYADVFTGVYSVVAIEAALLARAKTGEGQHIDMALLDVQVSVLANQALFYLASGTPPKRMGGAHPTVVPYQNFPVKDGGYIIIAVGNDDTVRPLRQNFGACGIGGRRALPHQRWPHPQSRDAHSHAHRTHRRARPRRIARGPRGRGRAGGADQ